MGALVSLILSVLGGWPLALVRGAWSFLAEMVKTPIGAALVAGLVCVMVGDWRGATRVEARFAVIAERAQIEAKARTDADREIAMERDRGLALSAFARASILEEIDHAPLSQPLGGDPCRFDASRVLRIRPATR